MGFVCKVRNGYEDYLSKIKPFMDRLIEEGYAVGYKERSFDCVILSVTKEHYAEVIFSKYFINDLKIEIDLENYFFRSGKNITDATRRAVSTLLGKVGSAGIFYDPVREMLAPYTAIIGLVESIGHSPMPYELYKILTEFFPSIEKEKWSNPFEVYIVS